METDDRSCNSSADVSLSSPQPGPSHKPKAGCRTFKEIHHPVYQGIRERNGDKRICEMPKHTKKSRLWLEAFATPDRATLGHEVINLFLHSSSPPLNFSESSLALPRPGSVSRMDIRIAAVEMSQESVEQQGPKSKMMFVDEEEMFNMQELMDELAVGMLLTPLAMQRGFDWNGVESFVDHTLWSD